MKSLLLKQKFNLSFFILKAGSNFDGIPALLISIGCIVFAIGAASIAYLCLIRKK